MNPKIKNLLRPSYNVVRTIFKVNWIKTIRVNFALLPFKQAMKLPIVVTGKLIIDSLSGKATINAPISFGMINFGKDMDNMPISYCAGRLSIRGEVVFNGHCAITQSSVFAVWKGGKAEIGHCVVICSGVLFRCADSIKIGNYVRITSGCHLMDTNAHLIREINTGRIYRNSGAIEIGDYCWLTMNTSVMAGTVLPDYCITARGALLNKDYSTICENGTMLAGTPARPIKTGVRRLYGQTLEVRVDKFFKENPNSPYYQDQIGFDEDNESEVVKCFTI